MDNGFIMPRAVVWKGRECTTRGMDGRHGGLGTLMLKGHVLDTGAC